MMKLWSIKYIRRNILETRFYLSFLGRYQIEATSKIWYGRFAPAKVRSSASIFGVIEFPKLVAFTRLQTGTVFFSQRCKYQQLLISKQYGCALVTTQTSSPFEHVILMILYIVGKAIPLHKQVFGVVKGVVHWVVEVAILDPFTSPQMHSWDMGGFPLNHQL